MNEYKIVKANNDADLSKSVDNFLNQGYRCQGGVVVVGEKYYIQAMVRKKPVKS